MYYETKIFLPENQIKLTINFLSLSQDQSPSIFWHGFANWFYQKYDHESKPKITVGLLNSWNDEFQLKVLDNKKTSTGDFENNYPSLLEYFNKALMIFKQLTIKNNKVEVSNLSYDYEENYLQNLLRFASKETKDFNAKFEKNVLKIAPDQHLFFVDNKQSDNVTEAYQQMLLLFEHSQIAKSLSTDPFVYLLAIKSYDIKQKEKYFTKTSKAKDKFNEFAYFQSLVSYWQKHIKVFKESFSKLNKTISLLAVENNKEIKDQERIKNLTDQLSKDNQNFIKSINADGSIQTSVQGFCDLTKQLQDLIYDFSAMGFMDLSKNQQELNFSNNSKQRKFLRDEKGKFIAISSKKQEPTDYVFGLDFNKAIEQLSFENSTFPTSQKTKPRNCFWTWKTKIKIILWLVNKNNQRSPLVLIIFQFKTDNKYCANVCFDHIWLIYIAQYLYFIAPSLVQWNKGPFKRSLETLFNHQISSQARYCDCISTLIYIINNFYQKAENIKKNIAPNGEK